MGIAGMTKSQEKLMTDVYETAMDVWDVLPISQRKTSFNNDKDKFVGFLIRSLAEEIASKRGDQ
jgi:hypothetical protein